MIYAEQILTQIKGIDEDEQVRTAAIVYVKAMIAVELRACLNT